MYAQTDPNPTAAGGAKWLRRRGSGPSRAACWGDEARELNPSWTHLLGTGRPWVTWKLGLDPGRSQRRRRRHPASGSPATRPGPTCTSSARAAGAILVGTGTALADDPQLTARRPDGTLYPEPAAARRHGGAGPAGQLPGSSTRAPRPPSHLRTRDPKEVLVRARRAGRWHRDLAGGRPDRSPRRSWAADLVDEVVAYIAPVLLGVAEAGGRRPRHHDHRPRPAARTDRHHADRRRRGGITAAAGRGGRLMFTGIVEELGTVVEVSPGGRVRPAGGRGLAGHRGTPFTAPPSP